MRTATARIFVTALFAAALLSCSNSNGKSIWQSFAPPDGPVVAVASSAPCSGTQIVAVVSAGNCSSSGSSPGSSSPVQTGGGATPPSSIAGAGSGQAGAQGACGSGTGGTYDLVYTSSLSRWCVLDSAWQASGVSAYAPFFTFGDAVVATLNTDFGYTPKGLPFTFEAGPNNGSAHTPGDFGLSDEFPDPPAAGTDGGVDHFYGYLLPLHEAINTWTGAIGGSWPTDWWADHRSPFPNSMDAFFLKAIGDALNNTTLQQAAIHQTKRFDCVGSDGCDKEVVLFNTFFTNYGGFQGFANAFKIMLGDGIRLENVSPNPSPLLTEYVVAYLQLGFGSSTDLTPMFVNAGVGTLDAATPRYTVDSSVVRAVANAHCSIKAGGTSANPALQALQHGNYQSAITTGGTQAACPAECFWSVPKNLCSAKW